jgi:hypothetical protein
LVRWLGVIRMSHFKEWEKAPSQREIPLLKLGITLQFSNPRRLPRGEKT